jgi:DNA-binding GntR family transcriptional regulator
MSSPFDAVPPLGQRTAATLADVIREAILDGRLEPGEELKEEKLALDLGTSRTPVREALLRLATEGLVSDSPGRSARVRDFDPRSLADLYELRAVLAGFAAREAASRILPEQLNRLREHCARLVTLSANDDVSQVVGENLEFHSQILDAVASDRLRSFVLRTLQVPLVYEAKVWASDDQREAFPHFCRQLIRSLESGDAERAELLMREYILEMRDTLMLALERESDGANTAEEGT